MSADNLSTLLVVNQLALIYVGLTPACAAKVALGRFGDGAAWSGLAARGRKKREETMAIATVIPTSRLESARGRYSAPATATRPSPEVEQRGDPPSGVGCPPHPYHHLPPSPSGSPAAAPPADPTWLRSTSPPAAGMPGS